MTILERLGRGLMLAVAAPIMFAEEVLSTRDDVAHERERRAKAEGERDEARRRGSEEWENADKWRRAAEHDADRCRDLEREIETLRSELDSAATNDEQYHHTAATLQDRTRERDALLNASANHAAEVNALRARIRELEEQADRKADEKCGWCLADGAIEKRGDGGRVVVCESCWAIPDVYTSDIADRVALRAASCPSRRVADPLSVACDDCGASLGEACSAASRSIDA